MDINNMDADTKKSLLALAAQVSNAEGGSDDNPDWVDFTLNKGGEKNPKKTLSNTEKLLEFYEIKARYNEMTKETDVVIPNASFNSSNEQNNNLTQIDSYSHLHGYGMDLTRLDNHITSIGDSNSFHPVVEWIDGIEWDGVDRFNALLNTIETPNTELCRMLFHRWLMNAVAALYMGDGFGAQGVFVMIGAQGLGKTRWLSSLVPNNDWFLSGEDVKTDDKDSVSKLTGRWICELGEIDTTFKKSDISALKAWITKEEDEFRRPYARKNSKHKRRTVFCGSVNDSEFLIDDENRRYWCVEVTALNDMHDVDIGQFWAQMKHVWLSGKDTVRRDLIAEGHWLKDDEKKLMDIANEAHKAVNPIIERFHSRFDKPHDDNGSLLVDKKELITLTATEILIELEINNPTPAQTRQLASYLKLKGYERRKNDKRFHIADADAVSAFRAVSSGTKLNGKKTVARISRGLDNLAGY